MDDYEHELQEYHAQKLRQLAGVGEHDEIPKKLLDKYWELKRCMDRVGGQLQANDLAMLCFLGGFGKPLARELEPPSIVDLWRRKEIAYGADVEVTWRKKQCFAKFQGVNASNQVLVQIEGDSEQRALATELVRLPTAELAGA